MKRAVSARAVIATESGFKPRRRRPRPRLRLCSLLVFALHDLSACNPRGLGAGVIAARGLGIYSRPARRSPVCVRARVHFLVHGEFRTREHSSAFSASPANVQTPLVWIPLD